AAGGEDVLAVGMELQVGGAVEMAGGRFTDFLAGLGVEQRDLAGQAARFTTAGTGEPLAVRRIGGGRHALLDFLAQVSLHRAGLGVPDFQAGVAAGIEDEGYAFGDERLLAVGRDGGAPRPALELPAADFLAGRQVPEDGHGLVVAG